MPELTLAAAIIAGILSFLSPCVLPVVPAYLGQLGALTVAAASPTVVTSTPGGAVSATLVTTAVPSLGLAGRRWHALVHSLAFVFGFGLVFTLFGLSLSLLRDRAGSGGADILPLLRQIGGIVLVVMGLNVMGVLRVSLLSRSWRPLDAMAARRHGPIASRTPLGAFGLGAVFALGWTPCIGPTLGAIFGLAAIGPSAQVGLLFAAYSIGLGVPFIVLALALDRAPALTRPLLRHSRTIEILGGALVISIGLAILFDWLPLLNAAFSRFFPAPV